MSGYSQRDGNELSIACNNTLLRKRKLLVKNINILTGIDEGKIEQIKRDQ